MPGLKIHSLQYYPDGLESGSTQKCTKGSNLPKPVGYRGPVRKTSDLYKASVICVYKVTNHCERYGYSEQITTNSFFRNYVKISYFQ
jgi:hypothetical protein